MADATRQGKEAAAALTCAICGRAHASSDTLAECTRCGRPFCWPVPDPARPCGYRRDNTTDLDSGRRVDFHCRDCASLLWRRLGVDFRDVRTPATVIGLYILLCIAVWFGIAHLVGWLQSFFGM